MVKCMNRTTPTSANRPPAGITPADSPGRVLVTYASRFGTTADVAAAITATLSDRGVPTDVRPISEVTDLDHYTAVVIGGAINYDQWMPQARRFVDENEARLAAVPVAYFFTCGALFDQSARGRAKAHQYADKLRAQSQRIAPVAIGQFAGALDYRRMGLLTRLIVRVPFTLRGVSAGDHRDWRAIRTWADALPLGARRRAR